jgi:outer membrane protein TolC
MNLRRARLAVDLAEQEIAQQLNITWRSAQIAYQRLRLTREATRLAELKFSNEKERYLSGKITAHILSTIQSEVLAEQLAQEQAIADLNKAFVDLFAVTGSLVRYIETSHDK